jgi:hypothetical protein
MSTRCQVQVIQEQSHWGEKVTLYHHSDGYPEYIIPKIYEAYMYEGASAWGKGRAGKVASFLCWSDPGAFEPEEGHQLHDDIEYYYQVYCNEKEFGANAQWEVEIYHFGTPLLEKRQPIEILIQKYRKY